MKLTENKKVSFNLFKLGKFIPVMNIPEGRQWFWDLMDKEREEYKNNGSSTNGIKMLSMEMMADNRERFKKMFGRPTFTFRGEFFYKDYIFEYKGHLFLVGTAKDKGTVYEVVKMPNHKFVGVVKEFLDEFSKELNTI